jgi:hypothetical protein
MAKDYLAGRLDREFKEEDKRLNQMLAQFQRRSTMRFSSKIQGSISDTRSCSETVDLFDSIGNPTSIYLSIDSSVPIHKERETRASIDTLRNANGETGKTWYQSRVETRAMMT